MKRLASYVLTAFLLTHMYSQVYAEGVETKQVITVNIDGEKQEYGQSPIIIYDITMVPLRGIFEKFGAEVTWDDKNQKVTAFKDQKSIVLQINSKSALINGQPVQLDVEPQLINGRTMVPLRFVSEALGAKVEWDGTTKTINIKNITLDNGEGALKLTVAQSVEFALKNSLELKNAIADIERSEEVRDVASDQLDFTPIGIGNGSSDGTARSGLQGLVQADIKMQMASKQVEIKKDQIQYSVKAAYNVILQKQNAKEMGNLSLEEMKMKKGITDLKVEQGLASTYDQVNARNNVMEALEKVEMAQKELDQAYLKFNQLVGLPNDSRALLMDIPTFSKMEKVDLEYHIKSITTNSAAVWLTDKQIDLAKLGVDLYTSNIGGDSYEAKEIDLEKARNTAENTKKNLDEGIRTLYNSIKQLESQYAGLEASKVKAEEALKLILVKYDAGMATNMEIMETKLVLEQVKQQMFNLTLQLDNMRLAFDKPWVVQ